MLNNPQQLATIALDYHLFVEGWQMKTFYQQIIAGSPDLGIEILYEQHVPVACCVIHLQDNSLSVFVDEQYRHKKYGQTVIEKTLSKYQKSHREVYGAQGIEGSQQFYHSCGIAYFKNGDFSMSYEEMHQFIAQKITMEDIRNRRISEYNNNEICSHSKPKIR